MTSGIPFSPEEINYVEQHSPHEFPSIIARGLAHTFRAYNGGYRSKDSVAALMKWIAEGKPKKKEEPTNVEFPDLRKGRKKKVPA